MGAAEIWEGRRWTNLGRVGVDQTELGLAGEAGAGTAARRGVPS